MKLCDLPDKTFLTPSEVAKFFSVSIPTVYRWCDLGEMDFTKIAGTIRIFRASVLSKIKKGDTFVSPKTTRKMVSNGIDG